MNRSFTFAATSLSALVLVAATLATPASAEGKGRRIDIKNLKNFTVQTSEATEAAAKFDDVLQASPNKFKAFTVPAPEATDGATLEVDAAQPSFNQTPSKLLQFTVPEGDENQGSPIQEASNQAPVQPKAFTLEERDEEGADAPPELDPREEIADEEAPPKKFKKQPKAQVDAASSDDIEEEEAEVIAPKKTKAKPKVEETEAAEADDEEEAAPTVSKKMRLRYSPSLRRYVQVTDEDLAYETSSYETEAYEAPVYQHSYRRANHYNNSSNYNYLPSCEN